MNNKIVHMVAFVLLIVGGLNWLLTAFGYNVVEMVAGSGSIVERAIYVLIGLSAIYAVATHKGHCNACSAKSASPSAPASGGDMPQA